MPEYIFVCDKCLINFSITCSMSEFSSRKYFRCPECKRKASRDFSFDNVQGSVSRSLSECKTLKHYAEKQSKIYGKYKVEDMLEDSKTQKTQTQDLPEGMSRIEKPPEQTSWVKAPKKKRGANKSRKRRKK